MHQDVAVIREKCPGSLRFSCCHGVTIHEI
jgi:hypothetical protein